MNYIQQAFKGSIGFWKYILIPLGFFGLMVLQYIAIKAFNLDMDAIIKSEVEKKGENRFLIETLLPLAIGLFILLAWVKYIHKQSITSLTTSRPKVDWKRIWFSFFLWGTITTVSTLLGYFLAPDDYVLNFNLVPFLILAVIAILLVPLQTSFEEYLFRVYLMQGIGAFTKSRAIPLFFTSIMFGLMHIANPEVEKVGYTIMIHYIGTGFLLGIMTLMDEGLELALGFHAANNLFGALLITADWTVFQTPSIFKSVADPQDSGVIEIIIPVFVMFPILLFIFSKKYKWTNWKDKLFGTVQEPPKEDYKILE